MVAGVTLTLNEPTAVDQLDDAGQATGSLLGSLVIVARHRGVQLSKEQLIRDHQLKASDASVKETLGIAHASGLRASATPTAPMKPRWSSMKRASPQPGRAMSFSSNAITGCATRIARLGWAGSPDNCCAIGGSPAISVSVRSSSGCWPSRRSFSGES